MIIVVADDFTGAAELAGTAMTYGLKTELQTGFSVNREADVTVIDTNTRSATSDEATRELKLLLHSLKTCSIDLFYKKTDSVLRGHVNEELTVLLNHFPDKSILLAPANPSKSRTIVNGIYYMDQVPLHKTIFASDPEAPVPVSDVVSLINGSNHLRIETLKPGNDLLKNNGIVQIAETGNSDHMNAWADKVNDSVIPAGGDDFFEAILSIKEGHKKNDIQSEISFDDKKTLFICGSSLSNSVKLEEKLLSHKPVVVHISEQEICSINEPVIITNIVNKIANHFSETNIVILYVRISEEVNGNMPIRNIPACLAMITSGLLKRVNISQIMIEGGTTSSEVVRKTGWSSFKPVQKFENGTIHLQVPESSSHHIIVKPGSYEWPECFWRVH